MGSGAITCNNHENAVENVYFSMVNGEIMDGFQSVMVDGFYAKCTTVQFKVLAVCEQGQPL